MNEPLDRQEPLASPLKIKLPLGKVVLINVSVMLVYIVYFWSEKDEYEPYPILIYEILTLLSLAVQVSLNLLAGLILVFNPRQKHIGKALLLGGVITAITGLVIGMSLTD
ncbi:MAG: hypothetical protein KA138_11820 [Saprospiraceae bacterium]|jgi:hypothetical protein|nr:hypothetical protein [Saprospiraceae bacterium]